MKILTFDIEEWFHILDHESTKTVDKWAKYEPRIHNNVNRILNLIEHPDLKATFFCLGWITQKYPDVVKKIADKGYELASHSDMHQLSYEMSPLEFKNDVERSIKSLEDLTGQKIICFRSPGFSITEKNKWALEILTELGIEIDCSIFPANRSHGGFPSFKSPVPSIIKYNGIILKELPINYISMGNIPVIFSGGGYFRLLPYYLIKKWTLQSDYVMSYLHPRDFDPLQPKLNDLSTFRKFKSYVGLKKTERKLKNWLTDFEFTDINTANQMIDWNQVPTIFL
jgi:polysaccharide deacetylase family protein (PEP-CTERM system associated)